MIKFIKKLLSIIMSKFDILIQFGFDFYKYYKNNDCNIDATKKYFIENIKKINKKVLDVFSKAIVDIHKSHLQFIKYLNELKINYITLDEKNFNKINIQDGIFRYIPLIELYNVEAFKIIYSKNKATKTLQNLINFLYCCFSYYNDTFTVVALNTGKPLISKLLCKVEFNECSVCLETISLKYGNHENINSCEKCCNILCQKCITYLHKNKKNCPICQYPLYTLLE